eukprot:6195290-Pleurochrysis_carterae.AAC.1
MAGAHTRCPCHHARIISGHDARTAVFLQVQLQKVCQLAQAVDVLRVGRPRRRPDNLSNQDGVLRHPVLLAFCQDISKGSSDGRSIVKAACCEPVRSARPAGRRRQEAK